VHDTAAPMVYLPLPSSFDFSSPTGFGTGDGVLQAFAPPQVAPARPRMSQTLQMLSVPVPLGRNRSGSGASSTGSVSSGTSELSRRPSWEHEETTIALAVPAPMVEEPLTPRKSLKDRFLGRP